MKLILPTELAQAFNKVIDAIKPLSFEQRRRVLGALEVLINEAENEARVAALGKRPTILPSIHPDKWTTPPKLPPLPPPPSDEPPPTKPKRHTRRNTK